tara:strand:- start:80 stop:490 length:411 start_codon:yes stop_codon:yes gene_type:complete
MQNEQSDLMSERQSSFTLPPRQQVPPGQAIDTQLSGMNSRIMTVQGIAVSNKNGIEALQSSMNQLSSQITELVQELRRHNAQLVLHVGTTAPVSYSQSAQGLPTSHSMVHHAMHNLQQNRSQSAGPRAFSNGGRGN